MIKRTFAEHQNGSAERRDVIVDVGATRLRGDLTIPATCTGVAVFAHGSGSSRHSRRNQTVARFVQEAGIATLLFDLLTRHEEEIDDRTRHLRFDIGMLAERLVGAASWVAEQPAIGGLRVGYYGSSTGGSAALVAAARMPDAIGAVVSRGGRPDLAGQVLAHVAAPTLLVVGERDTRVLALNQEAYAELRCEKELRIVPGASHLFDEPGALEQVAHIAADWFVRYLA